MKKNIKEKRAFIKVSREDLEALEYEINEVRACLKDLKQDPALLEETLWHCLERNDRLGTALDILEKYL